MIKIVWARLPKSSKQTTVSTHAASIVLQSLSLARSCSCHVIVVGSFAEHAHGHDHDMASPR